ncbi:MAG: hypothetical protein OHK0050_08940 [Roseiflexaceae bacterium]
MPLDPSVLKTQLLRVAGDLTIEDAIATLQAQPEPHNTYLLVDLGNGQLSVFELLDASGVDDLTQPLTTILQPLPIIDGDDTTIEEIRSITPRPLFVIVNRNDQPVGVVRLRRGGSVLSVESTPRTGQASSTAQPLAPRNDRYVNTDIATLAAPLEVVSARMALTPGEWYVFRLRIGEQELTADAGGTSLQEELQNRDIDLDIVLFSDDVDLPEARGRVHVPASGATSVVIAASDLGVSEAGRLFFRFQAPNQAGEINLRSNIYYNNLLVQSRLTRVIVGAAAAIDTIGTMRKTSLDFNLSSSLLGSVLGGVEPQLLSVMLNSDASGATHSFRILGGSGQEVYTHSSTLSANALGNLIDEARKRLRQVGWGKEVEWSSGDVYRYNVPIDQRLELLRGDLLGMANRGAILYNTAIGDIVGGKQGLKQIRTLLKKPGMVQFASKFSANDIAPIALFYDRPLDGQAPDRKLCPAFESSLLSDRPLIDEPCFQGECPHDGEMNIICPSGFWGFRLDIGMPYPVKPGNLELATTIRYQGKPQIEAAYFRDFSKVEPHLAHLAQLGTINQHSPRSEVLKRFQQATPQVIYFYCHGVETGSIPSLRIGGNESKDYLTPEVFSNFGIDWEEQRPLVFINGCHTAALTPSKAISFVRSFVEDASAAGVIGTEITNFEEIATTFAESFLKLFLAGKPFGSAIRAARLELLKQRIPLGLIYLPLAYAGLTMQPA